MIESEKNDLILLSLLTIPSPTSMTITCFSKTYNSTDFKPFLLLIDSAIGNTISPSLTQKCIPEDFNCPSSWFGSHASSGFNYYVQNDSAIWLTQLRINDQFHDQSLLCLLAKLNRNLRPSRKGTVLGSPIRTTGTREEYFPKVNVGVCCYRGWDWENLLGRIKTRTIPAECSFYQIKPLLLEHNRSSYKEDFFNPPKFIQVPINADFIALFTHTELGLNYRIIIQSLLDPDLMVLHKSIRNSNYLN